MRVRIVYRNYKPLHAIYKSLIENPPEKVEYVVPRPVSKLKIFYPMSKWFRYIPGGSYVIAIVEKIVFSNKKSDDAIDLYHYVNIIDDRPLDRPYVVDIEHAASLISFTPNEKRIQNAKNFLLDPRCKAVNCLSVAAKRTLKELMGADYKFIDYKVNIIYPALPEVNTEYGITESTKYIKKSKTLKVLFVGNQAYLKGLEELLLAIEKINKNINQNKLEVYVISADAASIISKYNLPNVKLFEPTFSKEQILSEFFLPSDVFIIPTKEDTFGMAALDALVSGTPVIATNQFALPELVTDSVDGFLIDLKDPLLDTVLTPSRKDMKQINKSNINTSTVAQIFEILSEVLFDKEKLAKLGNNGKKKFESGGQFSISQRNSKLAKVYKNALS